MLRRSFIALGLTSATAIIADIPAWAADSELDIIKQRILEPLMTAPSRDQATEYMNSLGTDGTWADIDYTDTNGGNWHTSAHVSRVLVLARALVSPKSALKNDDAIEAATMRTLDHWLEKDYRNPNWWWNEIGIPGRLARCLLVLQSRLSDDQLKRGVEIIKRAKIGMTGANLVDVAVITLMRSILENDTALAKTAVKSITDEIKITVEEGTQPDFSFHQHGPLLYNHGYGAVFMEECSELALIVAGTGLAFPKEKIDILSGLILDGTQWMIRYATKDYGATGRGLTRRSGKSSSAGYLRPVTENMLRLPTGRDNEYRQLLTRLDGGDEHPLSGNRMFWRSDFMAHHRKGWYASARMASDRLYTTDGPSNGEGLLSHNLSNGCTFLMKTGMEYHDIFAAWDWKKIPGTTTELRPLLEKNIRRMGTRPFAGGVSDGMYGAAGFDLVDGTLKARKSWFFFDDEMVCLGSGISSDSGEEVVTTLNQCFLRGGVLVESGGKPESLEYGDHDLNGVGWVYHDNAAYIIPGSQPTKLKNDTARGSWSLSTRQGSKEVEEHDLFTLWFGHGKRPENNSYSYVVRFGVAPEEVSDYTNALPVDILSNTPDVQAIGHRKLNIMQAVFYQAGEMTAGNLHIEVDHPCVLMLREKGNDSYLSVADPRHETGIVSITVGRPGKPASGIDIDLPDGVYAGQSVTRKI